MISKKMWEWLENMPRKPDGTPIKDAKYYIYMKRIQKRIVRELVMANKLADKYPDILLDEEREYTEASGKIKSNRRIKLLIQIIMRAKPNMQCDLVLKRFLDEVEKSE